MVRSCGSLRRGVRGGYRCHHGLCHRRCVDDSMPCVCVAWVARSFQVCVAYILEQPRTPPPTVKGTKIFAAAWRIKFSMGWSLSTTSRKAVMFKNEISSAPSFHEMCQTYRTNMISSFSIVFAKSGFLEWMSCTKTSNTLLGQVMEGRAGDDRIIVVRMTQKQPWRASFLLLASVVEASYLRDRVRAHPHSCSEQRPTHHKNFR